MSGNGNQDNGNQEKIASKYVPQVAVAPDGAEREKGSPRGEIPRVSRGDWVEITAEVLPAGGRAPGVPAETQEVPLLMRVRGFCLEEARLGEEVAVETLAGRTVRGQVTGLNPWHEFGFGRPFPELLSICTELRAFLDGNGGEPPGRRSD